MTEAVLAQAHKLYPALSKEQETWIKRLASTYRRQQEGRSEWLTGRRRYGKTTAEAVWVLAEARLTQTHIVVQGAVLESKIRELQKADNKSSDVLQLANGSTIRQGDGKNIPAGTQIYVIDEWPLVVHAPFDTNVFMCGIGTL